MGITCSVDELTWLETAHLSDHHCKKRIRCNVERHSEEHVCTALIELAGELAVSHIELEERMTRRQSHLFDLSNIPRRHDHTT